MAITRMISREKYEANVGNPNFWIEPFYPGHEAGLICHSPACPHYHAANRGSIQGYEVGPGYADCIMKHGDPRADTIVEVKTGVWGTRDGKSGNIAGYCSGPSEPLYMERSHVGLVLSEGEYNGYDDSDFYATVWDPEKKQIDRIVFASTRGWTYPNHCNVDATPEVVAEYEAALKAARERAEKRTAQEQRVKELTALVKGRKVEVFKGRKVAIGTVGTLFWIGAGKFGQRVGIKDAKGETYWTSADNVRVVLTAEEQAEVKAAGPILPRADVVRLMSL